MNRLEQLLADPRVTVRREGKPTPDGKCVVYWMQRAQRGADNPALNVAIAAANELQRPLAVFFGLHPNYPNANQRHYAFLIQGLEETKQKIEERGAAFIFRPFPNHDLLKFCAEVNASLVVGDENPMREPEGWRRSATRHLTVPFWTVDADVVVPAKLFPKEEYAARTIRPKLQKLLPVFFQKLENLKARFRWTEATKPASQEIDPIRLM